METFDNDLSDLARFFKENPAITCEINEFSESSDPELSRLPFLKPDQQHRFYRHYSHGTLKWKLKEGDEFDLRLTGSINMLAADKIIRDWKGITYFDSTPDTSRMKLFKPIDLFSDDACVGIYEDDPAHLMHLYSYEGSPTNLELSIDHYLLMALKFRGFYFWQYLLEYFTSGNENEVVQDYESLAGSMKGFYPIGVLKEQYNQLKKS